MDINTVMPPPKTSPRDFFVHLLSMVTLYASAISFTTVVYQVINLGIPDILDTTYYNLESVRQLLRGGLSFFIIMFPAYLISLKALRSSYAADAGKKQLRFRKWLIYFTLFASALINLFTLVFLLRRFLDGELTLRFGLKLLSVFLVAGSTLVYYWWELKQTASFSRKIFIYIILFISLILTVIGVYLAGSPNQERKRRFDDARLQALQIIQGEIVQYWQTKGKLPPNVDALIDNVRGFRPPVDPETNQPFGYQVTASTTFSLCASFDLPSQNTPGVISYPRPASIRSYPGNEIDSWNHAVGYTCFARTIDPERYPPLPSKK